MVINYGFFSKDMLLEYKQNLDAIFSLVISELKLTNQLEINLNLVSKRVIKKLNKLSRKVNKVTDVLSYPNINLTPTDTDKLSLLLSKTNFPNDINIHTGNLFLGEIMLCYPVIKKQAKLYENTLMREMCYMTVHGILHLLGYDHYEETDKKKMRIVEEKILKKINLQRD